MFLFRITRHHRSSTTGAATQRFTMPILAYARRAIAFIVPKLNSQSMTQWSSI